MCEQHDSFSILVQWKINGKKSTKFLLVLYAVEEGVCWTVTQFTNAIICICQYVQQVNNIFNNVDCTTVFVLTL